MKKSHLRILVVEDTSLNPSSLKNILRLDKNITVIDTVSGGEPAIEKAIALKPDLITMDISSNVLEGFRTTKRIMQLAPTPIVIVPKNYTTADVTLTYEALKSGAVDILPKPSRVGNQDYQKSCKKFLDRIWLMSEIKVVRKYDPSKQTYTTLHACSNSEASSNIELVVIGASAGGPLVLQEIIRALPLPVPFPIIIVQHVDPSFAEGFTSWLQSTTNKNISMAHDGEPLKANMIYFAPANRHIGLRDKNTILISNEDPINACKPSVSFLFHSVKTIHPRQTLAILLSGMGKDGALELKQLRDAGATTIAQSKASSLVHGMPGEAIKLGGACMEMSSQEISDYLNKRIKS